LFLSVPVHAQTSSDTEASEQFFRGYLMKNDAEKMEKEGNLAGSLSLYQQMQEIFDSIAQSHPTWQPSVLGNRRSLTQQAISRIQAKQSQPVSADPAPAATMPATATPAGIFGGAPAPIPNPGTVAGQPVVGGMSTVPSLSEAIAQWEQNMRQRVTQLENQNGQMQVDLSKWQQWYQWASGEITTARADKQALETKTAKLEESIQAMRAEVAAGRATQAQLDVLTKEKIGIEVEYKKVIQRIAAAENASKDANLKLNDAAERIAVVEGERNKLLSEREALVKERDAAKLASEDMAKKTEAMTKELETAKTTSADMTKKVETLTQEMATAQKASEENSKKAKELSAQNLGMKTEIDSLKAKGPSSKATAEMQKLLADNERLKKELATAEKQIVTLKADGSRKDQEIASLRGQVTTLQGEMAALRQQSSTYQIQVAELTLQLKTLQEDKSKTAMSPELAQENATMREIVMRQLRSQYRQQQAKDIVISELQKMEGVSQKLLQQVEELKNSRMSLTPAEEKLFTDPAVQEMLSANSIQGTLIARVSKPNEAANPLDSLLNKASDAFAGQKFSEAASIYEDALRADPKNTTALVGLGYAREREQKYDQAETALKKCLVIDPKHELAAYHLGITYFKQEKWNDALGAFEKNVTINTKNARSHHYLGIISNKLNFLGRAEREFKTAIAIDPNYGEAHFNLAVVYATWDPPQWDKAKSAYESALAKGVAPDQALEKLLKDTAAAPKTAAP
jgi:tetratricopeptide (TPR) repeat protein